MGIYDTDFSSNLEPAVGRPTGFFENVGQGFQQQFKVDSAFAYQNEIQNRWNEVLNELETQTGEAYGRPSLAFTMEYARSVKEGNFDRLQLPRRGAQRQGREGFNTEDSFQQMQRAEEALRQSGMPSFSEVISEVDAMQREVERQTALMSETGGTAGTVGQFVGAIGGSFTSRDPLNLATLSAGGFGKTVARRVFSEMAIAGAVESVNQFAFVQPNREMAGLPRQNAAFNVAAATVGAGLFQGGLEGLLRGVGRVSRAREARRIEQRDAAIRDWLEERNYSPRARGAIQLLDQDEFIRRQSPYGTSRAGMQRFTAELDEVVSLFNNKPMTAIGRVLPEVPFSYVEQAADFQLVKDVSPEIYGRLERAQRELELVDTQIEDINLGFEETTIVDAVRLVDKDAAQRIEAIAQAITDETPEPQLRAAEIEVEAIINRLGGEERIAQAVNDAEITPKKELQRLRKQRRARNREYKQAFNAVEREREKLVTAQQRLDEMQQAETVDLLGTAMGQPPVLGPRMSYGFVQQQAKVARDLAEQVDNTADRLVRDYVELESDMIDVGLTDDIDPEFTFDSAEGTTTARQLMDDLAEDRRLDEAMRNCLL